LVYKELRVAACRGSYEPGNRIQNKKNWCLRASKAAMGGRKHLLHESMSFSLRSIRITKIE
jgi:hypothetical protein